MLGLSFRIERELAARPPALTFRFERGSAVAP